jgi:rhodanese-related sulfurtransferase
MNRDIGERLLVGLRQGLVLLAVTLALATALWLARPDRLPLRADTAFYTAELSAPLITPDEALADYDDGTHIFLDARADADSGGIPGALPLREGSFDDDLYAVRDFVFAEDPLIVYGDGNLQSVSVVAARLQERGYRSVFILRGGLEAWRRAGGPLADGKADE